MAGGIWFPCRGRSTNLKKFNIRFFRHDALRIATNNFSTLVGRGGYGSLFKGLLPDDRRAVAILRLHKPYRDGFLEMVEFMSHLRHINLIQVIGCCVENNEQLLVCEFVDNGSVWHHLQSRKRRSFSWERRASVCIGTARGLSYLHDEIDPRVIHRDIKPSNILLDANFVPKIVDFDVVDLTDDSLYVLKGGSELYPFSYVLDTSTTISTTPKGTPGYSDPNYMFTGPLTEKADVYSFGVTMLEIITGRNSIDMSSKEVQDQWILHWAKKMRIDDMVLKMVDPMLTDFPKEDVERFINVALLCVHPSPEQRPSMFQVVHLLYGGHKSDREISEMATRAAAAAAAQPAQWSTAYGVHVPVSMSSLTISTIEEADVKESDASTSSCSHSSIIPIRKGASNGKGKCSSKTERLTSSGKEVEQSCEEGVVTVRECFERSMEKIMRIQAATHSASNRESTSTQTMVIGKSSRRVFMEAVYPPFPSGEYPRRPSQMMQSFPYKHKSSSRE